MNPKNKTKNPSASPRTNGELRSTGSAAEKIEHQESLKRLKAYKKKRKQQIIGLGLECLLLIVVVIGYIGISYFYKITHKITDIGDLTASQEVPEGKTAKTLPVVGPSLSGAEATTKAADPSGPDTASGETETTPEETDPPTMDYTFPQVDIPDHSGFYTFVVYGVDARDTTHLLKGTQGDVCIIVSINKNSGEVRLASVYRDFSIEVQPDLDRKLTDCYSRYGAAELTELLNRNFDLNITHFLSVNWLCLINIVDELGGLDIELSEAEAEAIDKYVWEIAAATGKSEKPEDMFIGTYHKDPSAENGYWMDGYHAGIWHLNGVQVVSYSRLRYGLGEDYGRTARQRKVIGLVLDKAKTTSPSKIINLIDIVADNMRTSLQPSEMVSLALQDKKYRLAEASAFPLASGTMITTSSLKWYIYCDDYANQVGRLHEFLYGDSSYTPSENVERISQYHTKRISER